jgi:hypothetical protein
VLWALVQLALLLLPITTGLFTILLLHFYLEIAPSPSAFDTGFTLIYFSFFATGYLIFLGEYMIAAEPSVC